MNDGDSATENLSSIVGDLINQLSRHEFKLVIKRCSKSRLSATDLERVIKEYGRKLISPANDAYEPLDIVRVESATNPTWSLCVPLWTLEEGRSDLTLELTISFTKGLYKIELDDLHVL